MPPTSWGLQTGKIKRFTGLPRPSTLASTCFIRAKISTLKSGLRTSAIMTGSVPTPPVPRPSLKSGRNNNISTRTNNSMKTIMRVTTSWNVSLRKKRRLSASWRTSSNFLTKIIQGSDLRASINLKNRQIEKGLMNSSKENLKSYVITWKCWPLKIMHYLGTSTNSKMN